MPAITAEKWFESLKKSMENMGYDLNNPASSLFLNDMNLNPVPAVQAKGVRPVTGSKAMNFIFGAKAVNDFSKENIDHLFKLAQGGKLTLTPKSGDFEEIRNVTVTDDGNCKLSTPVNRLEDYDNAFFKNPQSDDSRAELTWKQTILTEYYNHPEYYSTQELAQERTEMHVLSADVEVGKKNQTDAPLLAKHPLAKTLNVEKRISDFYKESQNGNVKFEELLSAGLIRDSRGMPFTIGSKPWDRIDYVTSELMSDKPIFVLSPDGDKVYRPDFKNERRPEFSEENPLNKLVDPKIKEDSITALKELQARLNEIKPGKNDRMELEAFKALCNGTISEMELTPYKQSFEKSLRQFAVTADQYYKLNITHKASKRRLSMLDICKDIKNIDKCVSKQKLVSENKLSNQDKQRYDIATKSVITLAMVNKQSDDVNVRIAAQRVLDNPDDREKQIEEHMNSTAFKSLYGTKTHPGDDKLLTAASLSKGKDLVKVYNDKVSELKQNAAKYEEQKDRTAQSRNNTIGKGPVSPDVKEDLKDMIAAMKQEMDSLRHESRTSKEFQDFKRELDITHIRLQRNNPTMNVRKQIALLAQAADKYYLAKTGEGANSRRSERFRTASRIRHMADAVAENKKPSENMPSEKDMIKEDIAAKLVSYAAEQQRKLGAAENILRADRMINNPREFRKNVNDILASREFKNLYGDVSLDKLKEDLAKSPSDINKKISAQKRKIDSDPSIMPVDKQKKKEEIKKDGQSLTM